MERKTRILYIDILNILACISVIALHHNGLVHRFENTWAWKESLVFECAFYWAVPVFLMISGVNLLNYREKYSTQVYFKKRVLRTVIPWLVWSIIVLIWKVLTGQMVLEEKSLSYILNIIVNNKVENVYWFFGALFACYLTIPIFSLLVDNKKVLWYIVALNFVFLSCLPVLRVWFGITWSLDVPVVGGLIIYVLLGYLIEKSDLKYSQRVIIYLLGIFGFLLRYIYTYIMSMRNQVTDTSIKGYAMFHAVFLSVAIFVWIKQVRWERWLPEKLICALPKISSCSFGIYLIHRIVMYYEGAILNMNTSGHVWRIIFIPITYLVSLLVVFFLKKIPGLGKILV